MERHFYDLDIQSELSSGRSSVLEIVNIANRLNYQGIAISDFLEDKADLKKLKSEVKNFQGREGIDVYLGAKIRAESLSELKNKIKLFRDEVDLLIVDGGNVKVNRGAVEDSRVDILSRPEYKRKDSGVDHVIAKSAAKNNVAIELNVNQLLKTKKKLRSHILGHLKRNVRLAKKYDCNLITSSGANDAYELRSPRDMAAFPYLLGTSIELAIDTVSKLPSNIIERSQNVREESFIRPGQEKLGERGGDSNSG